MDAADYNGLCAWIERQHQEALVKLQTAYDANRRAIDSLWEHFRGCPSHQSSNPVLRKQHGNLIESVRNALHRLGSSFTLQDVEALLRVEQPLLMAQSSRKSISTALRRLYESRELALIQEGRGTKPARYAVASSVLKAPDGKEVPMGNVSGRQA